MGCICCYAGKIMTEDKSCVEQRLFNDYCFYKNPHRLSCQMFTGYI